MCKMNFWCSLTIIFIILIAALVLTNSVNVHVSSKHHDKTGEQLNDFRKEAYKTNKNIEILANFAEYNQEHGKRQRRQVADIFDNFDDNSEEEKLREEQVQPNCSPDICKARNCAVGTCSKEKDSKNSLKTSKELDKFFNDIKLESKNMPREIMFDESESNGKEVEAGKTLNEQTGVGDRQKRFYVKSGSRIGFKFHLPQTKKNDYFLRDNQIESDVSSCQQCSQNKGTEISDKNFKKKNRGQQIYGNNFKSHKAISPISMNENKFSEEPQKYEAEQNSFRKFERKNNKIYQANAEDEDDEEEDDLYKIKEPIKESPQFQHQENKYTFDLKLPAFQISKNIENSPLDIPSSGWNDQFEETKNNLSHEANYKLSKDEQDAAANNKFGSWKWRVLKRSPPFNAMNEIKLKTSQRLMKKGFGASLPSDSLAETQRDFYIENMLRQKENEMLESNNNKNSFGDTEVVEKDFADRNNQFEDLAKMPLEPVLDNLPTNNWSKSRQKGASDTNARYKRELSEYKSAISDKITSLEGSSNRNTTKALKTSQFFILKDLKNEIESSTLSNQSLVENSGSSDNKTKNSKALQLLDQEESIGKLSHLQIKNNDEAKFFHYNRENSLESYKFNKFLYSPKKYFKSRVKCLKRVKRFNPSQTLDLKIYQKLHKSKAKRPKNLQHLSNKKNKKLGKQRHKRALNSNIYYAKSSAGELHFNKKIKKNLKNKFFQVRKIMEEFATKAFSYLTFRKKSSEKSSSLKVYTKQNTITENSNSSKENELNNTIFITQNKSFIEGTKSLKETKNPKLKFLNDFCRQFLLLRQYNKSFDAANLTRSGQPRLRRNLGSHKNYTEKQHHIGNCSHPFESSKSNFKSFLFKNRVLLNKIRLSTKLCKIHNNLKAVWPKVGRRHIYKLYKDLNKNFKDKRSPPAKLLCTRNVYDELVSYFHKVNEALKVNIQDSMNKNSLQSASKTFNELKINNIRLHNKSSLSNFYYCLKQALEESFLNNSHISRVDNSPDRDTILKSQKAFYLETREAKILKNTAEFNKSTNERKASNNKEQDKAQIIKEMRERNKTDKALSLNASLHFIITQNNTLFFNKSNESFSANLHKDPDNSFDIKTEENKDLKKLQGNFFINNLNEALDLNSTAPSLDKTFNIKKLKKQAFEYDLINLKSSKFYNQGNSSQNFGRKSLKAKAFQNSLQYLKSQLRKPYEDKKSLNDLKSLVLKSNPLNLSKSLKRFKRSLDTTFSEGHPISAADKTGFLFPYNDLYESNTNLDYPVKMPSKSDIDIENSPELLNQEVLPAAHQDNNLKNAERFFKAENLLKNYNLQENKFDNLKFNSLWSDTHFQNQNFKQEKRSPSKPKKQNSKSKPNNFRIPYKRHNEIKKQKELTTSNSMSSKVQLLKDKYLNDLKNFNKNYKFSANNTNNSQEYSEKLDLALQNQILNCKAFASLEEFLNSLPKNLTQSLICDNATTISNSFTTEKIEMDLNTLPVTPEITTTTQPLSLDSTEYNCPQTEEECESETTESSENISDTNDMDSEQTSEMETQNEVTPEASTEEDFSTENTISPTVEPEEVNLNISINASVHGRPKDQHFCGNGSFEMIPSLLDDRQRRHLNLSPLERIPENFLRISQQQTNNPDVEEDLSDLISGQFSSKAVQSIFSTVQQSPELKVLWPSLKPKQESEMPNQQNFYAIRNQENEQQLRNSEKLLDQAMSAINAIVEQQARSRACIPLRPDLQEFYNTIVQSRQQQDMVREKRQNKKSSKKEDSSYQLHLLETNKIEEETKIVKKLLKQYDELPKDDQQQVAVVRDDLLKNLMILRQLQDKEDRRERAFREKRENDWDASDERAIKELQSQYSMQFLKLLKAAELYKEIKSD